MKKLLGFSLTTPLFLGLAFGHEMMDTKSITYFFIVITLVALALYGLATLEEVYRAERKKDK